MNLVEENGVAAVDPNELSPENDSGAGGWCLNRNAPHTPKKQNKKSSLKENRRILFIGAGMVLVLLLLAFNGKSHRSLVAEKKSAKNPKSAEAQTRADGSGDSASIIPILDVGRSQSQEKDGNRVDPDQLASMTSKSSQHSPVATLGEIQSFESRDSWHPAPYRPEAEPVLTADATTSTAFEAGRQEREALDKDSLVFIANNRQTASPRSQESAPDVGMGVGLPPGTRLRARLESALSTATDAPVVAVIEYNYERSGEILIPAGSKALGRIASADRSGYVGVRFDSLMMPEGTYVSIAATATNLHLRPLRGKIEGKHTGQNIVVRSLAGLGEITATLVGRGSLNQPLSEGDLLRERISNNIGQVSDESVAELATNERIVVSVPADTEIYIVLQKETKSVKSAEAHQAVQIRDESKIEELRQLLELQREMNQNSNPKSPE